MSIILLLAWIAFAPEISAQTTQVSGIVTDKATGEAIIGVNILQMGTTNGAITDINGNFTLNAPRNATLRISSIGYVSQNITVPNRDNPILNIVLAEDAELLEEVVVVGYGTQRKRDVAGSISTISNKDLSIQSATNVQNLLQGRMSGVSVATSGVPGENAIIRIRGIGTISNNSPLYVIDGFPTRNDAAAQINPASIESIQVLKDAASASIYGAQAANGVILITTKQGKAGKVELNVKLNTGVQMPRNLPKMLNSQQYGEVLWNAMKNAGMTPNHPQYGNGDRPVMPDYILPQGAFEGQVDLNTYNTLGNQYMRANKEGTDWAKEVYRPGYTTNIDVSAQGGTDDSKYFISIDYMKQDAIIKWAGYDRIAIRANSQFKVLKNVNLGTNLSFRYSNYKGGDSDGSAVQMAPLIPVKDVVGNWAGTKANGLGDSQNPVANLYNARNNYNEGLNFLGNIFLEINFLNAFQFKTTVGTNITNGASKSFSPVTFWNKGDKNTLVNSLSVGRSNRRELVWNNTLTYSKIFNDHNVVVLLGTEALDNLTGSLSAGRNDFLVEDLDYRYLSAGALNQTNSESGSAYSLFSLFTRINYQYQDKYYISAIMRRDGSSRFGSENKYGFFPGVSAAWRISGEKFMANQTIFNDLKFRASYGLTGNSEIGNYAFASTYGTSIPNASYPIGGDVNSVVQGVAKESLGNSKIKWETTIQTNLGLDVALLNNKIAIQFDYYRKYTKDILQRVTYPATGGVASAPYENVGEIQNNGIEFNINYRNTAEQADFKYDIGLIIGGYRNEVKKLAANQFISGTYNRTDVGMPIGSFYGFIIDGIFQNQQEVDAHVTQTGKAIGRWRFRNVNGDDRINDNDRTYIGNPDPKFDYSLNSRLYYKNFDLTMYIQGVYGNKICFTSKSGQTSTDFWADYFNKSTRILDTWTENNRNAKLPQINILNPFNESGRITTYLIEDGSYLRFKYLELGYTIPAVSLSKWNIKQCRVYLNAENLWTLTNYNNIDPEVRSSGSTDRGTDSISRMPLAQVFSIGFSIGF